MLDVVLGGIVRILLVVASTAVFVAGIAVAAQRPAPAPPAPPPTPVLTPRADAAPRPRPAAPSPTTQSSRPRPGQKAPARATPTPSRTTPSRTTPSRTTPSRTTPQPAPPQSARPQPARPQPARPQPARPRPATSQSTPAPAPILAVGDSVMRSSTRAVRSTLGETAVINTRGGRPADEGLRVLRDLLRTNAAPRAVVLHLGVNHPTDPAIFEEAIRLSARSDRIVLVTIKSPFGWTQQVNEDIARIAAGNAKVRIADWRAHAEAHPEWLTSDGIHPNDLGQRYYAQIILQAINAP